MRTREESCRLLRSTSSRPAPPGTRSEADIDFRTNWAIEILPYLEEQALYESFDFTVPITNAANEVQRGTELKIFLCPSDSNNAVRFDSTVAWTRNWARGNYAGNVGGMFMNSAGGRDGLTGRATVTLSDGTTVNPWNSNTERRGVLRPNFPTRLATITDGTSSTMITAELRAGLTEDDPRGTWAFGHAGGNLLAAHGSFATPTVRTRVSLTRTI